LQEIVTWTDDIAGKTNDWGEERESVDRRAETSGQYTVGEGVSSKSQERWDSGQKDHNIRLIPLITHDKSRDGVGEEAVIRRGF
jgi:hypothetical protein